MLLAPAASGAAPMDPVLSNLVVDPSCRFQSVPACVADGAAFRRMTSEWGGAIAPRPAAGARSLPSGRVRSSVSASATAIASDQVHWQQATAGADPASMLTAVGASVAAGFGYGLEVSGSAGWVVDTSSLVWGLDVREAFLEALQSAISPQLPDASIGLGLRQATGLAEFSVSTLSLDFRLAWPLAPRGPHRFDPWVGYQWLTAIGSSSVVDLTPAVDALAACELQGADVPAGEGAEAPYSGEPTCAGSPADLQNDQRFPRARIRRHRLAFGLAYRLGALTSGVQVDTDLIRPGDVQSSGELRRALRCDGEACDALGRQWSVSLQLGAAF